MHNVSDLNLASKIAHRGLPD